MMWRCSFRMGDWIQAKGTGNAVDCEICGNLAIGAGNQLCNLQGHAAETHTLALLGPACGSTYVASCLLPLCVPPLLSAIEYAFTGCLVCN